MSQMETETVSPNEESKGYTETAKNILLSKAIELLGKATQQDAAMTASNDLSKGQETLELYERGLEIMLNLLSNEQNGPRRELFSSKADELMGLAEALKEKLKHQPIKKQNATNNKSEKEDDVLVSELMGEREPKLANLRSSQDAPADDEEDDYLEFDSVLNIEGVECYSILGQDKHRIASGSLQVLKAKDEIKLRSSMEDVTDESLASGAHHRFSLLKIGEFEFPLTKAIPCLRSSRGYYIVPMSGNIFYGFVFPKTIPDQYLQIFEHLLDELCNLRLQDLSTTNQKPETAGPEVTVPLPDRPSTEIAKTNEKRDVTVSALNTLSTGIVVGSQYAVQGIQTSSTYVASGIEKGGEFLKSRLQPNETPTQVNPTLALTLHAASVVSPYCVQFSRAFVRGLIMVAEEVGSAVATTIKDKMGPSGNSFNGPKMRAAKLAGVTAFVAFTNVWEALETAGTELLKQTSDTTVKVVGHKYGEEAAEATATGLHVAVDAVETYTAVKRMGVKRIAKKMAKNGAKTAAITYLEKDGEQDEEGEEQVEMKMIEGPEERKLLTN